MQTSRTLALALLAAALASAPLASATAQTSPAPAAAPATDPAAKQVLVEASAAMKKVTGLTFQAKRNLTGDMPVRLSAAGAVWYLRNAATPSTSAFYAKGTMSQPLAEGDVPVEAYFNGTTAVWLDEKKQEVVEKAVAASDAAPRVKNAKQQFLPAAFFDADPFTAELNAPTITLAAPESVDGLECDVVRLIGNNNRETRISIAKSDRLPRKIAQISPAPGGKGTATLTMELTGLKAVEVKPSEFSVALPAGYTRRVEEAPKPQVPTNYDPAKMPQPTPPPSQPKGGLDAGSPAPGWALKPADGASNITLADQKGKVVVMGFWGSLFGDSRRLLATLQDVHTSHASKGVAVFGVSCREQPGAPGLESARRAFADAKCSFPLLVDGDASATDYKLRGFPSVAVIDPTGKIAAFFESAPSTDALKAAIDSAVAAK